MKTRELIDIHNCANQFSLSRYVYESMVEKDILLKAREEKFLKEVKEFYERYGDCSYSIEWIELLIEKYGKTNKLGYLLENQEYKDELKKLFNNSYMLDFAYIIEEYKVAVKRITETKCKPLNFVDLLPQVLRDNLIKYYVGYENCLHVVDNICIVSYYFPLNEETLKWLYEFDDVFNVDTFSDFELLKDGKSIVIASTEDEDFY